MRRVAASQVMAMLMLAMTCFNGIFLTANGLLMLVDPLSWFDLIPGVASTGFFNQHFIRDIGLTQLLLGLAFAIGMICPGHRIVLWAAATLWLTAHAAFHLWEVATGICSPAVIPRDFPAVTLPAIHGALLTFWAIGRARAERTAFA